MYEQKVAYPSMMGHSPLAMPHPNILECMASSSPFIAHSSRNNAAKHSLIKYSQQETEKINWTVSLMLK